MKVKFVPQNIEVEIKPNESVLKVAQDHGIHIQSVCKGIPSCAECRVHIKEGETNVVPPLQPELELIGTAYYIDQRRLSCQLRCFGDVVIDLTEQIEKEHKSTKNPQGRFVKEREASHARMGNILEEEGALVLPEEIKTEAESDSDSESFEEPEQRPPQEDSTQARADSSSSRSQHQRQGGGGRHSGGGGKGRSHSQRHGNGPSKQAGSKHGGAANSQQQQGAAAQGGSNKNNNKRRNNNRRRNKPKPPQNSGN